MLCKRIVACLDVRGARVVKGVNFTSLIDAGDPAELARRYYADGADEIVLLDVDATLEGRRARARTVEAAAERIFVPLLVGGGIRSEDDAAAMLDAGADKVAVNSAALDDPSLITRLAARYGSQAVVVAIDAARTDGDVSVWTRSASRPTDRSAVDWAIEAADRGAGEILLTSIDRDGTANGFDCEMTRTIASRLRIPVIASGGAGSHAHFVQVFTTGCAEAALAASIFHFGRTHIRDLKHHLAAEGVPVRLPC
ncbi:MAG TPA: imidazole glycerol phosphate synthase subunit HisF [Vicinamibacterales bacterium]|jgi:cyclase|nr:imidazole glycerol phosphate synthase subunit HisF [Vicinamibacterales bacterium]